MKRAHLTTLVLTSPASVSAFSPSLPSRRVSSSSAARHQSSTTTSLSLAFDAQTFQTAAAAVDNFYKTAPLESAFLTCGIKGSLADAIAQRIDRGQQHQEDASDATCIAPSANRRESTIAADCNDKKGDNSELNFNPSRNLAYVIYGGMYTGIAQHFIYNELFPQIFGNDGSALTVLSEVIANALIVGPLLGLPVAYLTKAVVLHPSDNPISEGLRRYAEDVQLKGLLMKYWALWVPVQAVTFSVVPEHLRVAFMAAVSFFWFVILSLVSEEDGGEAAAALATAGGDAEVEEQQGAYPFPQRP